MRDKALRLSLSVAAAVLFASGPLAAQRSAAGPAAAATGSTSVTYLGIGTGLGLGSMSVGGKGDSATGLLVAAHLAFGKTRSSAWVVELTGQAFKVPSPVIDEEYRAMSFLVKRSFGSELMVSPALGFDARSWSGPQRVESSDVGLTLGLGIGVPIPISESLIILPEISVQSSLIELEGSVSGRMVSLRVSVVKGWR